MRSITRTSIRSASCIGALVLVSSSWFGTGYAMADNDASSDASAQPTATSTQTNQSAEQADGSDHGNTGKPTKQDPNADKGRDCAEHGKTGGVNEDHCGPVNPAGTTEPSEPADPSTPAEPTTEPSTPAEPSTTAEPSEPAESSTPTEPSTTAEPSEPAEPTTDPSKPSGGGTEPVATPTTDPTRPEIPADPSITAEVWWLLPEGADPTKAWEYTQTLIPVGSAIPCGRAVQADLYEGTEEQIKVVLDDGILKPGEDSVIYQDSEILYGPKCDDSGTKPSEGPSTPSTGEPSKPSTVEPSQVPSDLPLEPTQPALSTPASDDSDDDSDDNGSDDNGSDTTTVVVVTTTPEAPADLPMPQTNSDRPAGLPHTGDQADGFSPLGLGAGICGIVFASTFMGRKKK